MLTEWNERIPQPDAEVAAACREYVDNLTKPLGSLAEMEVMAVRLAGILGEKKPAGIRKAIFIAAADVATDDPANVSHGAKSYEELLLIANGCAPVSAVARDLGAPVFVADVGLERDTAELAGVMLHKFPADSGDPRQGTGMTAASCAEAIAFGAAVGQQLSREYDVVGLGQIGERGALAALGVTAAFLGPELAARAAELGLTPDGSDWKLAEREPETVLQRYGSPAVATLIGVIIALAAAGKAVVFDDTVTGAAVLAATRIAPRVREYVFSSAGYDDPLQRVQLHSLDCRAYLYYDFTLGQGLGSALGLSLLDGSLVMLNEMKTFGAAGVTVAEDGPGKGVQRKEVT